MFVIVAVIDVINIAEDIKVETGWSKLFVQIADIGVQGSKVSLPPPSSLPTIWTFSGT